MRRHGDEQVGLFLLVAGAAEERTEYRDVAQEGNLGDGFAHAVLQQSGQRQGLPVVKLHGGLQLPGHELRQGDVDLVAA